MNHFFIKLSGRKIDSFMDDYTADEYMRMRNFYRIWHKRIYKSLTWSVSETDFGCAKWDKWGDINNEESD